MHKDEAASTDIFLALRKLAANHARRRSFYALPRSHRLLLSSLGPALPGPLLAHDAGAVADSGNHAASTTSPAGRGFKARLDEIDDRIRRNADVLIAISMVYNLRKFASPLNLKS